VIKIPVIRQLQFHKSNHLTISSTKTVPTTDHLHTYDNLQQHSMSDPNSKEAMMAPPPDYSTAPLVPSFEDPPPYREEGDTDADEILPPCTFVLHGRFIYPLGATGLPDSEPRYEMSRVIHSLGRATESIDFQRYDRRVRTAADGTPTVTKRARDVYTMQHRPPLISTQFEAWLTPASRKTVGKVKIEKSPVFHHGYRAMKVLSDAEKKKLAKEREKGGGKEDDYHFVIKEPKTAEWEWSDPDGTKVASQWSDKSGDGGEDEVEHKLRVLVPLPRRVLDSLAAMWCLWMWHIHYERTVVTKKTWADRESNTYQLQIS
jgi:hypothetical protein